MINKSNHNQSINFSKISQMKRMFLNIKEKILNITFPPLCLSCNQPVNTSSTLCITCWRKISFITPPCCYLCGSMSVINHHNPKEILCLDCTLNAKKGIFCRSVISYNEICQNIIYNFKFCHNTNAKFLITRWLYTKLKQEDFADIDLIIPVPLHAAKIRKRGFNQCALICQELHKISKIDYVPNLLTRHKNTQNQGNLNKTQRYQNVKNAFLVNQKLQHIITNRNIVLIDDLRTTGATLWACAQALQPFKPRRICGLTLSRVL